MGPVFLFVRITFNRQEIEQSTDIFLLGGSYTVIYGIVVKLLAGDLQTIVRYTINNVSFQPRKSLQQHVRLSICLANILQISCDISVVSQYSLLTHALYSGNDLTLAQPQHICQIVNTRLGLLVLASRNVFLGNERFDDTHNAVYFVA